MVLPPSSPIPRGQHGQPGGTGSPGGPRLGCLVPTQRDLPSGPGCSSGAPGAGWRARCSWSFREETKTRKAGQGNSHTCLGSQPGTVRTGAGCGAESSCPSSLSLAPWSWGKPQTPAHSLPSHHHIRPLPPRSTRSPRAGTVLCSCSSSEAPHLASRQKRQQGVQQAWGSRDALRGRGDPSIPFPVATLCPVFHGTVVKPCSGYPPL